MGKVVLSEQGPLKAGRPPTSAAIVGLILESGLRSAGSLRRDLAIMAFESEDAWLHSSLHGGVGMVQFSEGGFHSEVRGVGGRSTKSHVGSVKVKWGLDGPYASSVAYTLALVERLPKWMYDGFHCKARQKIGDPVIEQMMVNAVMRDRILQKWLPKNAGDLVEVANERPSIAPGVANALLALGFDDDALAIRVTPEDLALRPSLALAHGADPVAMIPALMASPYLKGRRVAYSAQVAPAADVVSAGLKILRTHDDPELLLAIVSSGLWWVKSSGRPDVWASVRQDVSSLHRPPSWWAVPSGVDRLSRLDSALLSCASSAALSDLSAWDDDDTSFSALQACGAIGAALNNKGSHQASVAMFAEKYIRNVPGSGGSPVSLVSAMSSAGASFAEGVQAFSDGLESMMSRADARPDRHPFSSAQRMVELAMGEAERLPDGEVFSGLSSALCVAVFSYPSLFPDAHRTLSLAAFQRKPKKLGGGVQESLNHNAIRMVMRWFADGAPGLPPEQSCAMMRIALDSPSMGRMVDVMPYFVDDELVPAVAGMVGAHHPDLTLTFEETALWKECGLGAEPSVKAAIHGKTAVAQPHRHRRGIQ